MLVNTNENSVKYETINSKSYIMLQYCKVCGLGPKSLCYHHSELASRSGGGQKLTRRTR